MKLLLIAVGQRQPEWVDSAYAEFAKRFPPEMRLELKAGEGRAAWLAHAQQLMASEAERIESAIPRGARRIALDERGDAVTTVALAAHLESFQRDGRDVAFLVGGPDGLDPALKAGADARWRLSDLTLPHGLVRVLLAEALYRAWTVTTHHPYHRE
jgi:23S rRNA (pseudouridine1915-N3)-methyltransferase